MSSSSILSVSRMTNGPAITLRSSRGYCWSRRQRWSLDTYPKSLRQLDTVNKSCSSDVDRLPYRRIGNDLSIYNYRILPREGGRSSSSWAKWKSQWNEFDRNQRTKNKITEEDHGAWDRHIEKLEKETADIYKLVKQRIEADPFDALFGRRFLYPNRATWWNNGESRQSQEAASEKHDVKTERGQDPNKDGQRQQHKDISAADSGIADHEQTPLSAVNASIHNESDSQGYVIDPITMRKVPQLSTHKSFNSVESEKSNFESFDIPVKRFEGGKPQSPNSTSVRDEMVVSSSSNAVQSSDAGSGVTPARKQGWLAQEGFKSKMYDVSQAVSDVSHTARELSERLPDLGARASAKRSSNARTGDVSSGLSYNAEENRTEDVDLLRASDVRAASGLGCRPKRESEGERRQRRDKLEARFDENLRKIGQSEGFLREMIIRLEEMKRDYKEAEAKRAYEAYEASYAKEISGHKAAMEAMQMRQSQAPTASADSGNVHPAQGEGDMASNVHEFASRERWYKRKAPHAAGSEEQKAVQATKDTAFVKEIRGIYEDTYGTIDTKHRQPGAAVDTTKGQEAAIDTASSPISSLDKKPRETGKEQNKAHIRSGPLSSQEIIGTMLRQLLDDSQYMQRLLSKPGLSPTAREELFHRNRSMRNASDAIAEALTPSTLTPSTLTPSTLTSSTQTDHQHNAGQSAEPTAKSVASNVQEPPKPEPQSLDVKKPSMVYSVLAYDPSTQQVTTAEMSSPSDSPSERRLSLSEALSSLTEPAKFLPHLTTLQSQGYEIVSSDTNILVLRKTHKSPPSSSTPSAVAEQKAAVEKEERRRSINPIDGTTTQTGNFASPTGFVNHDSPLPPDALEREEAERNPSGQTVRRKEDVFSGPSGNGWNNRRPTNAGDATRRRAQYRRGARGKRTTKRMLWVGAWTAGCCYAVGATTEYLRA